MVKNDIYIAKYYLPDYVLSLKFVESGLVVVQFLCICLYMRILHSKNFCHINLKILLIIQPWTHWIALLTRPIRHVVEWIFGWNTVFVGIQNGVQDCFLAYTTLLMLAFSIERIVAMKYVDTYESMCKNNYSLGLSLAAAITLYCVVATPLWYFDLLSDTFIYLMLYLLFTLATIFFIALRFVSYRAYSRVAAQRNATVEKRYLTARNLKAADMLMYLAPYKCVTNFVSLILYTYLFNCVNPYYRPFYSQIYFIYHHIQLATQMLIAVHSHTSLRGQFRKRVCKTKNKTGDVQKRTVLNVIGKRMVFEKDEENRLYFRNLEEMWR